MVGVADTPEVQDVRRSDGTRRQGHFAYRIGPLNDPIARELDADRALAVEHDAVDQRVGDEFSGFSPLQDFFTAADKIVLVQ